MDETEVGQIGSWVGLDVGKEDHHATVVSAAGEPLFELAVSNDEAAIERHLCALPTGEHCSRGLVCLGCSHAQPKKSAAQAFRRMLASHRRALAAALNGGEPAGQIAARELEIGRIESALRRAEELTPTVAEAIEAAA
jgi:hypothetical protein